MMPLDIEWVWPDTLIALLILAGVALAGRWLLLRAIRAATTRAVDRAKARHSGGRNDSELIIARQAARAATMGSLLRSVTNVAVGALVVLTAMDLLGIPLTPLLASAGIGGIALGFGAQSLVKDYLSGISMILEDQYGVGDIVDLGEVVGTVEDVGLRITRVRNASGQVWYIRNGEIARVGNVSQGWSTASIDIPIDSDEDSARVIELLNAVAEKVHEDEQWHDVLLETPHVIGVQSVDAGRMTIRVVAKTQPNEALGLQRALLDQSLQALKDAGIRGPKPYPAAPTL